jgi:hypothetical protein
MTNVQKSVAITILIAVGMFVSAIALAMAHQYFPAIVIAVVSLGFLCFIAGMWKGGAIVMDAVDKVFKEAKDL